MSRSFRVLTVLVLGASCFVALNSFYISTSNGASPPDFSGRLVEAFTTYGGPKRSVIGGDPQDYPSATTTRLQVSSRCAINLFGLPRAFKSLVLPSLKMNVIPINPLCDYFVHYYNTSFESAGRAGAGGFIKADEILLLKSAVLSLNPYATVMFTAENETRFQQRYATTLSKIDDDLYKPKDLDVNSTTNIIRMWNSIQTAWNLMVGFSRTKGFDYDRVAFLRSDVVFATPLDIWEVSNNRQDVENKVSVIPAFGSWPVNDRMIYGPWKAVQEWAARHFEYMDVHVQWALQHKPGVGIHSETFVAHRVIPNIQKLGYQVWEHDKLCFMRARADGTVWVSDCDVGNDLNVVEKAFGGQYSTMQVVENAINRSCIPATTGWIEKTKTRTVLCQDR